MKIANQINIKTKGFDIKRHFFDTLLIHSLEISLTRLRKKNMREVKKEEPEVREKNRRSEREKSFKTEKGQK